MSRVDEVHTLGLECSCRPCVLVPCGTCVDALEWHEIDPGCWRCEGTGSVVWDGSEVDVAKVLVHHMAGYRCTVCGEEP